MLEVRRRWTFIGFPRRRKCRRVASSQLPAAYSTCRIARQRRFVRTPAGSAAGMGGRLGEGRVAFGEGRGCCRCRFVLSLPLPLPLPLLLPLPLPLPPFPPLILIAVRIAAPQPLTDDGTCRQTEVGHTHLLARSTVYLLPATMYQSGCRTARETLRAVRPFWPELFMATLPVPVT
jgi:hypothetical protein